MNFNFDRISDVRESVAIFTSGFGTSLLFTVRDRLVVHRLRVDEISFPENCVNTILAHLHARYAR